MAIDAITGEPSAWHVGGGNADLGSASDGPVITVDIEPIFDRRHDTTITLGAAELVLKGEDRHAIRSVQHASETLHIAVVADGHGGKQAASHCRRVLIDALLAALHPPGETKPIPATGKALRAAGRQVFLDVHTDVLSDKTHTAGSTLTLVVVNQDRHQATVLHVGDSVVRLVPHRSRCVALCEDHRIDTSESERERLVALGGLIARATNRRGEPAGPLRLWPGGVAQARAIGDRDVGQMIDARPFAKTIALPVDETSCLVVCSDGVWDAMLPAAVDSMARVGLGNSAEATARSIVQSALTQRHAYSSEGDQVPRDDTTCVVVLVQHPNDVIGGRKRAGCCS